ncbi:ABC transporter ATP-binding protein [Candidatus Nomurabacteria bacterium]|jgi:ATP-binding cassette subfamily B protein|nr:MAG: ABC transporter ATP-binding protein [Candidatus Nomurabacteria bacterium]
MKILVSYLKQHTWLCVGVILLATINQTFSLLDPLIFRHIIDDYATKFDSFTFVEFFRGVSYLLLLAVGAAFVSRVAKNFQDYYLNTVTQRTGAKIYNDGIEHSLALPYEVFEDQRSGETLGTLQKVRTSSETFINAFINVLFVSIIGFIFVTIYAAKIYWGVAVVYALTIPIIGGLSYALTAKVKKIQKIILAETTALAGSTTESLRNIELVKSLGLVTQEINRLNATTDKILKLELKKLRYIRSISFVQGTLINLMRTLILAFLLYLVFAKIVTFGQFFSLYIYSFFIFQPLQELGNVINSYREAQVALKRFEEIMHAPSEPKPDNSTQIPNITHVAFKDISFKYKSAGNAALENITFEVTQGETIAFVGPSGSGKTSLVKLLVGLYTPKSGEITFNDIPMHALDMNVLRGQFGFVTQDTQLFAGTIRENLLFVNPYATDDECLGALASAQCQNLLARGGAGLDTVIGEGGVKVSGGEKQRLSVARALLRKPTILIFDEATSSLDSITEEEITKTIRDVSVGNERISVLIAHRLSTIMHADRIYVLEKGNIVEVGNHDELLDKKGLYFAMWRQQIGERV